MSLELLILSGSLALAPTQVAQAAKLELTNVRPTYGELGPTKPDWKVPLGDALHVAFDLNGLSTYADGRVRFRTTLEVENSKGEKIYKPEPLDTALLNIQAGGKVRHSIVVSTGIDQTPGIYRLRATVTDTPENKQGKPETKDTKSFTQDFTLLPAEFAMIRFQMAYDRLGQLPAPCAASVGQTLFVTAVVLGFKPDPDKKNQASFQVEMTILDASDKPTSPKPALVEAKVVPAGVNHVPVRFDLPLHRPGQFKIMLKANDLVGKKTATLAVPLQVVEPK